MAGRPLKVGVQLPEIERVAPWPDMKRMATTAEALGYDSIWFGDHLLYKNDGDTPKGPWEAWTMMAAIAAVTDKVELGPLVACTSFHNAAMIDVPGETGAAVSDRAAQLAANRTLAGTQVQSAREPWVRWAPGRAGTGWAIVSDVSPVSPSTLTGRR